jgi:hypothetical protein
LVGWDTCLGLSSSAVAERMFSQLRVIMQNANTYGVCHFLTA